MKHQGVAILQVPFKGDHTFELDNYDCTDKVMNFKLYGHPTHVRRYGKKDFLSVIHSAGFKVDIHNYAITFSEDERKRYGLDKNEIFLSVRNRKYKGQYMIKKTFKNIINSKSDPQKRSIIYIKKK